MSSFGDDFSSCLTKNLATPDSWASLIHVLPSPGSHVDAKVWAFTRATSLHRPSMRRRRSVDKFRRCDVSICDVSLSVFNATHLWKNIKYFYLKAFIKNQRRKLKESFIRSNQIIELIHFYDEFLCLKLEWGQRCIDRVPNFWVTQFLFEMFLSLKFINTSQ